MTSTLIARKSSYCIAESGFENLIAYTQVSYPNPNPFTRSLPQCFVSGILPGNPKRDQHERPNMPSLQEPLTAKVRPGAEETPPIPDDLAPFVIPAQFATIDRYLA